MNVKKTCFVVMGFKKKVAYTKDHKPRTLDLDATYESIIKPAAINAGLECERADEFLNSGMIDTPMYKRLLNADLVIADISTGNVNAVYELGIRHALRPFATIIMQEDEADFHFDLSHISTFTYKHLGEDIGSREAGTKKRELQTLIEGVMANEKKDSPIYEVLPHLEPPAVRRRHERGHDEYVVPTKDDLAVALATAEQARRKGELVDAARNFAVALQILESGDGAVGQSEVAYVTQQLALTTYKSKSPSEQDALEAGLAIIEKLDPNASFDTETLGITGAIRKNLWKLEKTQPHLDKAIEYYGRGFRLTDDYYNGENYVNCLMMRAEIQTDTAEQLYDVMTATKARETIVDSLDRECAEPDVDDRPDRMWMHATMANCLFALRRDTEAREHERRFLELCVEPWQIDTYESGKAEVIRQRDWISAQNA